MHEPELGPIRLKGDVYQALAALPVTPDDVAATQPADLAAKEE